MKNIHLQEFHRAVTLGNGQIYFQNTSQWTRNEKIRSFEDGVNMAIKAGTTCVAQVSKSLNTLML